MNFYSDLKIRNKLIFTFSVAIACSCLVGFFGINGLSHLKAKLDDINDNLIPSMMVTHNISRHVQQHRRHFLRYLPEKSSLRIDLASGLDKEENQIIDAIAQFRKFPLLPEEKKLLDEVNDAFQVYLTATAKLKIKADAGASYEAMHDENARIYEHFNKLETQVGILSKFNADEAGAYLEQSNQTYSQIILWMSIILLGVVFVSVMMTIVLIRCVANPLRIAHEAVRSLLSGNHEKKRLVESIAAGNLDNEMIVSEPLKLHREQISSDEAGSLLKAIVEMSEIQYLLDQAFAEMAGSLRHSRERDALQSWFRNGQNELNTVLRGDKSTSELTEQALEFLTEYLGAGVGVFYVYEESESTLRISASYALTQRKRQIERIALGEGLAGQAALERRMITLQDAPSDYLSISSGLGESEPSHIVALPLLHNNALLGLVELGSFTTFGEDDLEFLKQIMEALAIALGVNKSRQLVNELLEQTQAQAEELRVQQEELQQTNEELEERAQMLEQQREQIRFKNREMEQAGRELQKKADELERVSTYKSEFLANMSHELRTPLNSLMILSSLLADNREGNLTGRQVEFAATINGAGRDLLNLINDILDLSKIESGHMEFHYEELTIAELCSQLESVFNPIAGDKGINFSVKLDESTPKLITGDAQRTQQILKNLLSNACKFTAMGSVIVRAYKPDDDKNPLKKPSVAFDVIDSGIGIPADKQSLIFNAFQQADGSTSRTYGGTGLGLSISRQLARSMGGEVSLVSEPGVGTTFTLYLPIVAEHDQIEATFKPSETVRQVVIKSSPVSKESTAPISKTPEPLPSPIADDRDQLQDGGRSILIIEDDLTFVKILIKMVRDRNFHPLVADNGESGIAMAERYLPNAIILDVMLPSIDGWSVMRSLKDNPVTRHIPVHFITCTEERQKAMSMGAIGFVTKPLSREQMDDVFGALESAIDNTMKMLLIVEDDPVQAKAMVALLEERNVTINVVESGAKAIEILAKERFDCIVLDLGLADMGAFELLEELKKLDPERRIPVIIHTGRELTHDDEKRLHHYAESIIIKGAKSPERLLNEVTLFLHLVETSLDPGKQRMIRSALDKEAMLDGKKILIVDDDMRNIFSLSSALTEKNIVIYEAENGIEALKRLDEFPDIDLVLMDIMMPEMDGYEAMRRIRLEERFRNLPIIALTAKAMKGDREECLKAGASDYIPKPVDISKLFSLLRVWLYNTGASDAGVIG